VNFGRDADIRDFFEHGIADKRTLRLIAKWLHGRQCQGARGAGLLGGRYANRISANDLAALMAAFSVGGANFQTEAVSFKISRAGARRP
jgi:hypothetical protein